MRSLVIAGALACSIAPCLAQTPPPVGQLLPQITVEAPSIVEVTDPLSKKRTRQLTGTFTVRNSSRYDLQELEINCAYVAPGGTVVGNHSVKVYETFKAYTRQATALSL